ncbi:hypothetical protein Xen7305DRAFT_00053880 [Xenococcus sp. PCC 7305]|uniref:hypothetical protein n=1 Tax=Xenococcus sp. PCC 7305 TaxID=102125 RepID=UPI0002AC26E5|nr:hypothetical protein [Xenococcus sp. PCC 7305]ELS05638.1 hypothetical protein Xen7305DRAFT_00053880 [Xenococcus sp. PCC 7305]
MSFTKSLERYQINQEPNVTILTASPDDQRFTPSMLEAVDKAARQLEDIIEAARKNNISTVAIMPFQKIDDYSKFTGDEQLAVFINNDIKRIECLAFMEELQQLTECGEGGLRRYFTEGSAYAKYIEGYDKDNLSIAAETQHKNKLILEQTRQLVSVLDRLSQTPEGQLLIRQARELLSLNNDTKVRL